MAVAEVIEFQGSPDLMVWRHPAENVTTKTQLIVDPAHEALLVINGKAADLFGEGCHLLRASNLPYLSRIISIPADDESPFPCKVYYVNKVHQMDLLWGTKDAIPLEDPLYSIFMHVMIHGSLSYSITDSRKFVLKLCGLRDRYTPEMLLGRFRGVVSKHVKNIVSNIMINGQLSFFMVSANLMDISDVLMEQLQEIFNEYGITLEFFNVETISVPREDYEAVSAAKERRTSRLIEGYTWQQEREAMILEKFAGNEGSAGLMGGLMAGAAGGMVTGATISEIARNALSLGHKSVDPSVETNAVLTGNSPAGNLPGSAPSFDGQSFVNNMQKTVREDAVPAPAEESVPAIDPVSEQTESIEDGFEQTESFEDGTQTENITAFAVDDSSAAASIEELLAQVPVPDVPDDLFADSLLFPETKEPAAQEDWLQPGQKDPETKRYCSSCGKELVPGAKFCFECGAKVMTDECPSCGTKIRPGMKFCFECGYKLL